MKIKAFFRWYDLWIGAFIDVNKKAVYICPIPMFGIKIEYLTKEMKMLINKINEHQNNHHVHPLTCGRDSNHSNLVPDIRDGKVILFCKDCYYVQNFIPRYFN